MKDQIRITFVQWPTGEMAAVDHLDYDQNFINWLEVEVEENDARSEPHYDYYSMYEDHMDSLAWQGYERSLSYRTEQEIAEDAFLFEEDADLQGIGIGAQYA